MATSGENSAIGYNVYTQLELVMLFFAGALVLGLHVALYLYSPHFFSIFISVYVIVYAIIVIVLVENIKTALTAKQFSSISYFSFYSIFLQVFLILFALGAYMFRRSRGLS